MNKAQWHAMDCRSPVIRLSRGTRHLRIQILRRHHEAVLPVISVNFTFDRCNLCCRRCFAQFGSLHTDADTASEGMERFRAYQSFMVANPYSAIFTSFYVGSGHDIDAEHANGGDFNSTSHYILRYRSKAASSFWRLSGLILSNSEHISVL